MHVQIHLKWCEWLESLQYKIQATQMFEYYPHVELVKQYLYNSFKTKFK